MTTGATKRYSSFRARFSQNVFLRNANCKVIAREDVVETSWNKVATRDASLGAHVRAPRRRGSRSDNLARNDPGLIRLSIQMKKKWQQYRKFVIRHLSLLSGRLRAGSRRLSIKDDGTR